MSQTRETRFFDIIILVLFVLVVGWFATRSSSPTVPSLPGVDWPQQSESQLIRESQPILEGDPLPPPEDVLEGTPESPELMPAPGEIIAPPLNEESTAPGAEESDAGSWE